MRSNNVENREAVIFPRNDPINDMILMCLLMKRGGEKNGKIEKKIIHYPYLYNKTREFVR